MSSSSTGSTSSSASSSRRRVKFSDSDIVVILPPRTPPAVSEAETSEIISPTAPQSHSPTSTTSSSGFYTPPSISEVGISIEVQDGVTINSESRTPPLSDAVVPLEAKSLDTYENHGVILHTCLTISNPFHWNMLINPQISPRPPALDQFGHDFMTDKAFPDSISVIRINCDILPWPIIINIEQDGLDRSPLIEDISNSIYVSLWKLASSVDLNHQTAERQGRIQKAYRRRCRQLSIPQETDGLRRIDFLEGQTMFRGLSPGSHDDEWYLHIG
ncbi:hypothetical protein BYT27DRAFT_6379298 [Phlegmacium glaucopus]|nr:hypothetical protein BYT27DRAFT_6379298 [Phlegmacium glaucopus]